MEYSFLLIHIHLKLIVTSICLCQGFDRQGSEQLGCKLINTRKWIGATEIATVLRSIQIR